MVSDNRTAHENTLEQPNELMDQARLINLRYRACMSLCVSLKGTRSSEAALSADKASKQS